MTQLVLCSSQASWLVWGLFLDPYATPQLQRPGGQPGGLSDVPYRGTYICNSCYTCPERIAEFQRKWTLLLRMYKSMSALMSVL